MRRPLAAAGPVLWLLAAACAGPPPALGPAPSAAETSEFAALPRLPVRGGATSFEATIEAAAPPVVTQSDGLDQVVVELGTAQPLRCFVYPKPINLAQTLRLFVGGVAAHVAAQQVAAVDGGQVGGVPYLTVVSHYRRAGGDGTVKLLAARGERSTTLCMHDERGYEQSFRRVALGFVAAQRPRDEAADPAAKLVVWREVSLQRRGAAEVGITESRLYEGEMGYAFASSTSTLRAAEDGQLVAADAAENQFSNTAGEVLEAKYVKIVDEAVAYSLALRYAEGHYQVAGSLGRREVEAALPASGPLEDVASRSARVRRLFAARQPPAVATWQIFDPTAPERLGEVQLTLHPERPLAGGAHAATRRCGAEVAEVEFDAAGMQRQLGAAHECSERLWQQAEGRAAPPPT